jgi:hypothetical protein
VESEDRLSGLPHDVVEGASRWAAEASPTAPVDDRRRHRHLPAFYLSRFASEGGRIVVLRSDDASAPAVTDVTSASVTGDFYDGLDTAETTPSAAETVFGLIDDVAKQPLERLAFGVLFPPQPIDRTKLAIWLSLLMVRGPQARYGADGLPSVDAKRDLAAIGDRQSARAFLRRFLREEVGDEEADSVVYLAQHAEGWAGHAPNADEVGAMLQVALRMEQCFLGRYLTVVRFPDAGLVTCDRPLKVFKHPHDMFPDMGVGVATADEIWFPLDRSTALILHSNKVVGEKATDAPSTYTVDQFNQEVISSSYQEIYCNEADLEQVTALLPRTDPPTVAATAPGPGGRQARPPSSKRRKQRDVRAR